MRSLRIRRRLASSTWWTGRSHSSRRAYLAVDIGETTGPQQKPTFLLEFVGHSPTLPEDLRRPRGLRRRGGVSFSLPAAGLRAALTSWYRLRRSWWSAPPASPAPRADRASIPTRSLLHVSAKRSCRPPLARSS